MCPVPRPPGLSCRSHQSPLACLPPVPALPRLPCPAPPAAPLDEALVHVVLDLSGRPHLSCDLSLPTERIGSYETQLVEHFFQSLVNTSGMTLHIRQVCGGGRGLGGAACPPACLPAAGLLLVPGCSHVLTACCRWLTACLHCPAALCAAGRQELPPHCGGHLQGVCPRAAPRHRDRPAACRHHRFLQGRAHPAVAPSSSIQQQQ